MGGGGWGWVGVAGLTKNIATSAFQLKLELGLRLSLAIGPFAMLAAFRLVNNVYFMKHVSYNININNRFIYHLTYRQ